MADMDIDGLTPVIGPGLKGIAGTVLQDIERRALAEEAERVRIERERNIASARPMSAGDASVGECKVWQETSPSVLM